MLLPDWNILELDIAVDELNRAILFTVPGPTVPVPEFTAYEALTAHDDVPKNEPE
jgi:hypothetical protein